MSRNHHLSSISSLDSLTYTLDPIQDRLHIIPPQKLTIWRAIFKQHYMTCTRNTEEEHTDTLHLASQGLLTKTDTIWTRWQSLQIPCPSATTTTAVQPSDPGWKHKAAKPTAPQAPSWYKAGPAVSRLNRNSRATERQWTPLIGTDYRHFHQQFLHYSTKPPRTPASQTQNSMQNQINLPLNQMHLSALTFLTTTHTLESDRQSRTQHIALTTHRHTRIPLITLNPQRTRSCGKTSMQVKQNQRQEGPQNTTDPQRRMDCGGWNCSQWRWLKQAKKQINKLAALYNEMQDKISTQLETPNTQLKHGLKIHINKKTGGTRRNCNPANRSGQTYRPQQCTQITNNWFQTRAKG